MPNSPAIDLAKVRADTPHCEKLIHFNNAGAALSPDSVTQTQIAHLQLEQEIGGYEAADRAGATAVGPWTRQDSPRPDKSWKQRPVGILGKKKVLFCGIT